MRHWFLCEQNGHIIEQFLQTNWDDLTVLASSGEPWRRFILRCSDCNHGVQGDLDTVLSSVTIANLRRFCLADVNLL